ncbi:hypothetical protein C900_00896 [Fulvivirga imtechensis AK7]|uniref:Uncharacterized protein n=1 Tax=Fulvivirga imtechensis AK7 TaxID=1237149 RepID=L8JVV3_9BACT|nr:hypothetical protein C900_00896 [Fulvivirga imtechensis AK7]
MIKSQPSDFLGNFSVKKYKIVKSDRIIQGSSKLNQPDSGFNF